MDRRYYVYILPNASRTLYVGVTSDLERRLWQHRNKQIDGFTRRYNITKLVFFEESGDPLAAIAREKQIKGWLRAKKIALVESTNPQWHDLGEAWKQGNTTTTDSSLRPE